MAVRFDWNKAAGALAKEGMKDSRRLGQQPEEEEAEEEEGEGAIGAFYESEFRPRSAAAKGNRRSM